MSKPASEVSTQLSAQSKSNRIVKIWFSKPGTHPLGNALNEYRLIAHLNRFPRDEIHLVSNYEDHDEAARNQLITFCQKNKIKLISLNQVQKEITETTTLTDSKIQLELLEIAKAEIKESFGCLAAASDIVRTLSPVAKLGFYTDFDIIKTKTSNMAQEDWCTVFGVSLFLNIDYKENTRQFQIMNFNNSAFICDESKCIFLKNYRALIYKNYHDYHGIKEIAEGLLKEKTFSLQQYKIARQYTIDNKKTLSNLCAVLKIRCGFKETLTEEQYQKFLKESVLSISGPGCMRNSVEDFLVKVVFPKIKQLQQLAKSSAELEALKVTQLLRFLSLPPMSEDGFSNDNDASWLKLYDSTKNRLKKMNDAATKIQSIFRMHQVRKKM